MLGTASSTEVFAREAMRTLSTKLPRGSVRRLKRSESFSLVENWTSTRRVSTPPESVGGGLFTDVRRACFGRQGGREGGGFFFLWVKG